MARLCRIHLAGVGQESARFHPLTVDLRNPSGEPQDSIIWLRNGGGKTTFIALLYSTLVPRVADFLGMRNQKNAKLEDFVRPNELAVTVTEWQMPDIAAPRRVVGQVILLTARELKRTYFSFAETKGFSFESLPVVGLALPAPSLDRFLDSLRDAMTANPAMELVMTTHQGDWMRHLDQLGLDSDLFKTHIVMNSQEGGASDIFKIKTTEDFVRKFLELSYDESSTEELQKNLVLFREKRAKAPHYHAAITFGEGLTKVLSLFVQDAEKKVRLKKETDQLLIEMASMLSALIANTASLEMQFKLLSDQIEFHENTVKAKELDRRRANTSAKGFERLGKRLRVIEAKKALDAGETKIGEIEVQVRNIAAAQTLIKLRALKAELQALTEQRDRLHAEVKPLLDSLRKTGGRLMSAWNRRVADMEAAYSLTDEEIKSSTHKLKSLANEISDAKGNKIEARKDRENAETAIRAFEEARRSLQNLGALDLGESCEQALARHKQLVVSSSEMIRSLNADDNRLKEDLAAARSSHSEVGEQINQLRLEVQSFDDIISREAKSRDQILQLPLLVEIGQGESIDLHNPHLCNQLALCLETAQSELVTLGVKDAEDKRDVLSLDKCGLLAPPSDVETILSRLRGLGIQSALPAYQWLAEHHLAAGASEELHRKPLALSGIIIQNEHDYARAQAEVKSAEIRAPVAIIHSPKSDVGEVSPEATVVTPANLGLFSKDEALRERSELDSRRDQRATRAEVQEGISRQTNEALVKIGSFLKEFSAGRMKQLRDDLRSTQQQAKEAETEASRLAAEIKRCETERDAVYERKSTAEMMLRKAENHLGLVTQFDRDHGQKIEGHRKSASHAKAVEEKMSSLLVDLQSREAPLAEQLARLRDKSQEQHHELSMARTNRKSIPPDYVGDIPERSEERPEEIDPTFTAERQDYEGKAQPGVIEGKMQACAKHVAEVNEVYETSARGLVATQIHTAAESPHVQQDLKDATARFNETNQEVGALKIAYQEAQRNEPSETDFKAGDLQLSKEEMPSTSADCFALQEEHLGIAETLGVQIETNKSEQSRIQNESFTVSNMKTVYEGLVKRYVNISPVEGQVSRFTGLREKDDETTTDFIRQKSRSDTERNEVQDRLTRRFDRDLLPLIHDPKLDAYRIPFRDRLKLRTRDDFETQGATYIPEIEEQLATYRHELESEEQDLRIIVSELDAIARRTSLLLGQTESVSRMPDGLGAWAGHPFLKITVPKKNDEAERHTLLRQAMESWYAREVIPTGHLLAFECVYAVCGSKAIGVKLLKPEYHPSPVPHEITDLVKFSDGEKLTAAILLYCVLVRLRAKQRAKTMNLGGDSGMLLLDNPFGKATLPQFVDLQLKMARMNGVQLIYATGVGDYGALKSFTHFVRLRNTSRSRGAGDYHVTHDPNKMTLEGVALGIDLKHGKSSQENGGDPSAGTPD